MRGGQFVLINMPTICQTVLSYRRYYQESIRTLLSGQMASNSKLVIRYFAIKEIIVISDYARTTGLIEGLTASFTFLYTASFFF